MPYQTVVNGWHDFYIVAGTASATLVVTAVPSLTAAGRDRGRTLRLHRLVLRFGFSIVSYLAVIVAGVLLFSSLQSSFTWLAVATIVLLIVSLRNTWDLLVTVGDVTSGGEGERIETG